MVDIVIRNARVRGYEGLCDIAVDRGRIIKVGRVSDRGEVEINAEGRLVTESFVNPHLHLCKAYTFLMIGEEALEFYHGENMNKALYAIEAASKIKEKYREDWIYENAKKGSIRST